VCWLHLLTPGGLLLTADERSMLSTYVAAHCLVSRPGGGTKKFHYVTATVWDLGVSAQYWVGVPLLHAAGHANL